MTDTLPQTLISTAAEPDVREVWQLAVGRLRSEMSKALFETWVEPLQPLHFRSGVFTLGAANPYGRDWVESRLKSSLTHLLEGIYGVPLSVQIVVHNSLLPTIEPRPAAATKKIESQPALSTSPATTSETDSEGARREGSHRKLMLQRAYGSHRAAVVQPERGMFLTLYFFNKWLPLLGHSAMTVILAARSMCYWNPITGEMRNTLDTDMSELARRAAVSVRTVKDVLALDLVQRYFLRYVVRRVMTPNGVRTAGITLLVRMDDPITPEDQSTFNLPEEEYWYPPEFETEKTE